MCPGFVCKGAMRKHCRKSLSQGMCGCNMTRSRIRSTDDRRRKTLAKGVFPDILLQTYVPYSAMRCSGFCPFHQRCTSEVARFAMHLVPPCARVSLTAAVKPFPFQCLIPLPQGSERQFEETPFADLGNSGGRNAPRLPLAGGGGDRHKAGNGSP